MSADDKEFQVGTQTRDENYMYGKHQILTFKDFVSKSSDNQQNKKNFSTFLNSQFCIMFLRVQTSPKNI